MVKRARTLEAPANSRTFDQTPPKSSDENGEISGYEQFRDQRIKENQQRMQKLGLLDLSLKLKSGVASPRKRFQRTPSEKKNPEVPLPPRRSSRLQNQTPISYVEVHQKKSEDRKDIVREGQQPEIYTEEHDKLLGTCEGTWVLFQDGYDSSGTRIYDPVKGKTCHQCRQKTLGHRTHCSICNMVQGQFCGDCLYMRYGEHVLEANQNPNWSCPVCRGICNCSLCRIKKGWAPTGALYKKITRLGFKSVAHYLIQIKRAGSNSEDPVSNRSISAKRSLPFTDAEENYQQQIPGYADQGSRECLSRGTNGMKDENCTEEMEMQTIDENCDGEKEQEVKHEKCIGEMAMRTLDGNCDGEKEQEVKHEKRIAEMEMRTLHGNCDGEKEQEVKREKCIGETEMPTLYGNFDGEKELLGSDGVTGEMEMRTFDGNFDGEKELLCSDGFTACIGELYRTEKPKM